VVGCKASIIQIIVEEVEGSEMLSFGFLFHGTGKDSITVVGIAHKTVAMPETRRGGKLALEIGGHLVMCVRNGRKH
jgi:hypothetical protein